MNCVTIVFSEMLTLSRYQKKVMQRRKHAAKKKLWQTISAVNGKWRSPSRHQWRYFHEDEFDRECSDGDVKQEGDDVAVLDELMLIQKRQPENKNWWRIAGDSLFFGKYEHRKDAFQVVGDFDGRRISGYVSKQFLRCANYHPKLEMLKSISGDVRVRVSRFHSFSLFITKMINFPPLRRCLIQQSEEIRVKHLCGVKNKERWIMKYGGLEDDEVLEEIKNNHYKREFENACLAEEFEKIQLEQQKYLEWTVAVCMWDWHRM